MLTYLVFFSLTSQQVYLLKVLHGQLHTVFLALTVSQFRYALPAQSGFLSCEQVDRLTLFCKEFICVVFLRELIQLEALTLAADKRLFC